MGVYTIALGHGSNVFAIVRGPYSAKVVKLTIGEIPDDEEIIVEFGERLWTVHLARRNCRR